MNSRAQQLTGPDRWQISYADLVTLLLGFFIVMYAVSSMEAEEKNQMISALQYGFSQDEKTHAANLLSSQTSALLSLDSDIFEFDMQGEWLYLTAASKSLFSSASAQLTPSAKESLNAVVPVIERNSGLVEVEGHTDNQPITSALYPNNWALSSARAVAVVSYLIAQSDTLEGQRFKAIGYGEYAPLADNTTPEGRENNRRVVIKIEDDSPLQPEYLFQQPIEFSTESKKNNISALNTNKNQKTSDSTRQSTKALLQSRLEQKGILPQEKLDGGVKFSKDTLKDTTNTTNSID